MIIAGILLLAFVLKIASTKKQSFEKRLQDVRTRYELARKAHAQACQLRGELVDNDDSEDHDAFSSMKDTFKVLIGNLQIIAQLPLTLKFHCEVCSGLKDLFNLEFLSLSGLVFHQCHSH
jgi:hypothetical protein